MENDNLTRLEDLLLHSREEAKGIILQLRAARKQLEENNGKLQDPQQYQQNTLLLEAMSRPKISSTLFIIVTITAHL